ncbi:Protein of unknown function, partial [Gryllus bimaculatus]
IKKYLEIRVARPRDSKIKPFMPYIPNNLKSGIQDRTQSELDNLDRKNQKTKANISRSRYAKRCRQTVSQQEEQTLTEYIQHTRKRSVDEYSRTPSYTNEIHCIRTVIQLFNVKDKLEEEKQYLLATPPTGLRRPNAIGRRCLLFYDLTAATGLVSQAASSAKRTHFERPPASAAQLLTRARLRSRSARRCPTRICRCPCSCPSHYAAQRRKWEGDKENEEII